MPYRNWCSNECFQRALHTDSVHEVSDIEQYIRENEPVEQDGIRDEFGRRGLAEVKRLMTAGRVSYTRDWMLQTQREVNREGEI